MSILFAGIMQAFQILFLVILKQKRIRLYIIKAEKNVKIQKRNSKRWKKRKKSVFMVAPTKAILRISKFFRASRVWWWWWWPKVIICCRAIRGSWMNMCSAVRICFYRYFNSQKVYKEWSSWFMIHASYVEELNKIHQTKIESNQTLFNSVWIAPLHTKHFHKVDNGHTKYLTSKPVIIITCAD